MHTHWYDTEHELNSQRTCRHGSVYTAVYSRFLQA